MDFPKDLKYSIEHEWVALDDNQATVGISDHAQDALGDIVYLELPNEGDRVNQGEVIGQIESVKAVSELYTPLSGTVIEVNQELTDAPETVNEDPYGEGWMIKIELSDPTELETLMSAGEYRAFAEEESG